MDPKLHMVIIFSVLAASALWLFLGVIDDERSIWLRLAMIIVGAFSVYLLSNRDMYLPFLGETVFPLGILNVTEQKGNVHFKLANLPPNTNVVYWAALPKKNEAMALPSKAYGNYENGGVVASDHQGNAHLSFECPQSYVVGRLGFKHILPKHVHYRYQLPQKKGILSRVFTEKISCEL
jgi:hypothetical protein